jgi:hypothetical protein
MELRSRHSGAVYTPLSRLDAGTVAQAPRAVHNRAFIEVQPEPVRLRTRAAAFARRFLRVRREDFAILQWAPVYKLKYLYYDLMAALVVGTMLVPQAMAYAILAGLPPAYGLYSSIFPSLVYFLLTTCSQVAPGPVA